MVRISFLMMLLSQAAVESDIDAFMEKVLEQRDINWKQYYNYFFKERAELSIEGSIPGVPLQGFEQEFSWFARDGYAVRSPVSADGVTISASDRDEAEKKWIERVKKRKRERNPDRETFLGFKFEPGNYFYAGRQKLQGREVVVVEYYPEKGFSDDDDDESEDEEKSERELEMEAKLNKTLLVTMLIDPTDHQIVKMTLDNFGFEFIPGKWLFQLDTVEASMVMHKPFDEIWLPRDITAFGRVRTAAGNLSVRYTTRFYDYSKAETGVTFRFPPRGLDETEQKEERKK